MMKLSIVTTLYYSALYIQEFYERITKSAKQITDDYEIIFVNDGSPDNSLEIAIGIHQVDSKVTVVDLSRNFGHHKAMMTGLNHAVGEYVFLIDIDLEEEPELLEDFYTDIVSDNKVDVVYGVQKKRKGGLKERITGEIFYFLYNKLSSVNVPRNLVTVRIMTQKYVKSLLEYKEQEIFIAGIWSHAGYNQRPKSIVKFSSSETTYSIRHKISLLINAVTSFSVVPLRLIFLCGSAITFFSLSYALYIATRKFLWDISIDGWTSLIVSVWFFGGLIVFSIGLIGLYLSKIFIETKKRPYTLVKQLYKQ